ETDGVAREQIERATFRLPDSTLLVFVNGHFCPELSSAPIADGLIVCSLAEALRARPDLVEPHLARYASYDSQASTALNTAFIQDGAFVSVPKGTNVERPIHLIFTTTSVGEGCVTNPRNLVLAGSNARLSLVESYVGLREEAYFTDAVT